MYVPSYVHRRSHFCIINVDMFLLINSDGKYQPVFLKVHFLINLSVAARTNVGL